MRATGAEVVKLAVMAHRLSDCLPLRALTKPSKVARWSSRWATRDSRRACSRRASDRSGPTPATASRRVKCPPTRLSPRVRVRSRLGRQHGDGVRRRRTACDALAFACHAQRCVRGGRPRCRVPAACRRGLRRLRDVCRCAWRLPGASVTAPFKLAAFERGERSRPVSERVGSANTLKRCHGQWSARNTDVAGFLAPLEARLRLAGRRATVLGAGGAARAVVEALASAGAEVTIAARDRQRAADLASHARASVVDWPPPAGSWDVLVNATPVGTAPDVDETPLPDGPFTGELVYDLVYNPLETRFCARLGPPAAAPSAGSTCWSPRPSGSSSGGPAEDPPTA